MLDFFAQSAKKIDNNITGLPEVEANQDQLQSILAVLFGVAAAIAVLSIMIAAFNFATADGDADKISRAKKTIVLSLIGLAIAITAEFLVLTLLDNI